MSGNPKILTVDNLAVSFENGHALHNISFSVDRGDVLAIVGPNGAGKSVLFRTLLDLIPHSGTVTWSPDIKVNYIPQRFTIERDFPLTVKEFFNFKTQNSTAIHAALRSVGAISEHEVHHHILNQRIGWLSGGQIQRILIAWAIIDNPDVILFDEPTAGIDIGGEETIYNLIKKIHDERKLTILIISHDLNVVYKYADRVLCLNKDMICYGAPEDVLDPAALKKLYGEVGFYSHKHDH